MDLDETNLLLEDYENRIKNGEAVDNNIVIKEMLDKNAGTIATAFILRRLFNVEISYGAHLAKVAEMERKSSSKE